MAHGYLRKITTNIEDIRMKKIISLGILLIIISCSGERESSVENEKCFSSGSKTYKWTMVTTWPKNFPGLGMGPENFAKYVDEMTCGLSLIHI